MRKLLKKLDNGIGLAEDAVCTFSLSVICVIVILQVFFRYVLNSGLLWGDEVVTNLMVLMVMFGAPAASRKFMHTDMQVFVNMLSKPVRVVVKMLTTLIGLAFLGLFFYSSTKYTLDGQGLFTTVLKIPMPYVYSLMPIGALLLLYEYIKVIPQMLKDKKITTNNN